MSAERPPVCENLEERTFFSVTTIAAASVRFPKPLLAQRAALARPRVGGFTTTATTPSTTQSAAAGSWRGSNPFGILAKFNRASGNWSSASPFSTIASRIRG